MQDRLTNLLRSAGMNRAVVFGVLARGSAAVLGAIGIALIASRLPPEVQGYHFTFLNLLLLQTFAELGLLAVSIQVASHQWAALRLDPNGRIEGDPEARSRLLSLGRFAFSWFFLAGLAVTLLVGAIGAFFFSRAEGTDVAWRAPWTALCALTGLKMMLFPALALLEGSQQVAEVYFIRWIGSVCFGLVFAGGLAGGLGLWSTVAGIGAETFWLAARLAARHRRFLANFSEPPAGSRVHWARDLRPLQTRIAVSWISGWFAFSAFTPLLFRFEGPASAGRWGLTWSLFALVTSVASLWLSTQAAPFGVWIARREYARLDAEFRRRSALAAALAVAGAALVYAGTWLLARAGHPWASRILPPDATLLLAAATVLLQVSQGQAIYLRAHGKEPFFWISLLQAALTVAGALHLGRTFGARGMAAAYLAGAVVVVPLGTWIWLRCRRDWHADSAPDPQP